MAATNHACRTASEASLSEPLALASSASPAFAGSAPWTPWSSPCARASARPDRTQRRGKTTLSTLVAAPCGYGGRIELFGRRVTAHAGAPARRARAHPHFQVPTVLQLSVLENCLLAVQALTPRVVMHRPSARDAALRARAEETLAASAGRRAPRCAPSPSG